MKTRHGIVHIIFHPLAARRFVEPLAQALIDDGMEAEIWVQPVKGAEVFLAGLKVPVKFCPSNLGFNPLKAATTFFALLGQLKQRRPLVVHAHLFRGSFLPLLASFFCRVPVRIYHNHGVSYVGYRGLLRVILMLIEAANCRLATHVATVNESLRPALQAVAPAGLPIIVFGPGSVCGLAPSEYAETLDPARKAEARMDLGLNDNDLVLVYIGRPHVHKGFPVTIEAFDRLFAADPKVKLLICGCSPVDVARVCPQPPPGIRALGYVNDLHPIYRAADAVLLPSLYEGLPYSLLEGAAQGCAMIASQIPGPDALIEEGKNGLFIIPGDVDDLVRALNQIDQNREELKMMGAAALEKALEFRRERIIVPYLAFMREVVAAADSRFRTENTGDRLAA